MERREVFRLALRTGAIATVTRLSAPTLAEAAEADAAPKVEFQRGTLRGGKFEGWEALLAITGRAVRGTIYDPGSLGGARFTGYRVRGVARGATLTLDFYDLEDVAFEKPIGGGKGKERRGKTTTRFEVDDGTLAGKQGGSMASREVALSTRANRELAGYYLLRITDRETEEVRSEFNIKVERNGKFNISNLTLDGAPTTATVVSGRLGAARDGSIYTTMVLPNPGELSYPFDPSEVNLLRPAKEEETRVNGPFGLLLVAVLAFCAGINCEEQKEPPPPQFGTVRGKVTEEDGRTAIAGASVSSGDVSVDTNAAGEYSLRLQTGTRIVEANKAGYLESRATLSVLKDQTINQDFELREPGGNLFADDTFNDSNWDLKVVNGPLPKGNSASARQQVNDGNPGRYRQTRIVVNDPRQSVEVVQFFKAATYDPRTEGAIRSLHFKMDIRALSSRGKVATHYFFVLRQNGLDHYYTHKVAQEVTDEWATFNAPGLTVSDFFGAVDFSAGAFPIEFGFRLRGGGDPDEITGVDNWSVVVEKEPV